MAGKGGGGAWKVAYADFVTAMMAFFLVMWITAQSKPVKTAVAEYFRDPYGSQKTPSTSPVASRGPDVPASIHSAATHPVGWGFLPGDTPIPKTGTKLHAKKTIPPDEDPNGQRVKPNVRTRILIAKLGDSAAMGGMVEFDDARADLGRPQRAKLLAIAADLAGKPHMIEIFGHTSNRPIVPGTPFRDRWDLTYARCRSVAELLESMNIERERLRVVVGDQPALPGRKFAPTHPLDCAVEVYLVDVLAQDPTPSADAAGASPPGEGR
ncbi:MAG: flagellar motor protein MotB [Thermoguttaceae bacterium]|jgi:chemotaxis protein MotB